RHIGRDRDYYTALAFSPDGKTLVTSGRTSLSVWDTGSGKWKGEVSNCRGPVAFSPDGRHIASGDREDIRLWDAATLREVRRFEDHRDSVRALAFSADGKRLASAHEYTTGIWDVTTGKRLHFPPGHHGPVVSLAFSPDGKALASGARTDGTAYVWDVS